MKDNLMNTNIELPPPYKKYTTGKLPSHSSSKGLAGNFKGLDQQTLFTILESQDYFTGGKPTRKAFEKGLAQICEKKILWNVENVKTFLNRAGLTMQRQYVNQELPKKTSTDPAWVSLSTIGQYFNVSGQVVGKWLDQIGLREKNGLPKKEYIEKGFGQISEVNIGGKKTRTFGQWDLHVILSLLQKRGHPFDRSYEDTLKGKGKNSDVQVSAIDERVNAFVKVFIEKYNAKDRELLSIVAKTPIMIQKRAEKKMKKSEGFISNGIFKERFNK